MPRLPAFAGLIAILFVLTALLLVACDDADRREATSTDSGDGAVQASSRAGPSNGFTGVFHATGDGTRSVVNLTDRDGTLTGMIDAAAVSGRVNGTAATGEVRDPGSAAKLGTVEMSLTGDVLKLTLTAVDPATGRRHELPAVTYARGAPPPIDVQLDAQLAGRWRHTWSAAGDGGAGAGVAVDVWLVLNPDGAIEYGKSESTGGDAAATLQSAEAGAGEDGFTGKWRTSEKTLLVMPAGNVRWIPFARYRVEGKKLLLTYNDGGRQVYYRN